LLLREAHEPEAFEKAASDFQRALELARQQAARSLELRAAISLARLSTRLGHRERARAELTRAYGSFTEGLATPELRDARNLLDTLG
jgi:adenylate cyclase